MYMTSLLRIILAEINTGQIRDWADPITITFVQDNNMHNDCILYHAADYLDTSPPLPTKQ